MLNVFENNKFVGALDQAESGPVIVTLDDVKKTLTYSPEEYFLFSTHLGQRKLYLAAVQYLTEVGATDEICVYAGSAPNFYAWDLHRLFPKIKFVYFDSNPHRFEFNEQVKFLDTTLSPEKLWDFIYKTPAIFFLFQGYFTSDICRAFTGKNVLFISDIRTNISADRSAPSNKTTYRANRPAPSQENVYANLTQQALWANIMQPKSASFKFRTPFFAVDPTNVPKEFEKEVTLATSLGINILPPSSKKEGSQDVLYFDGDMFIQAYPGELSGESRLLVRSPSDLVKWSAGVSGMKLYDASHYEDSYYYYNLVSRLFVTHDNPLSGIVVGYDNSNDCALETHIWQQYQEKINKSINTIDLVRSFNFGTRGNYGSGTLFPLRSADHLSERMSKDHYDYLHKKYADDYVKWRSSSDR